MTQPIADVNAKVTTNHIIKNSFSKGFCNWAVDVWKKLSETAATSAPVSSLNSVGFPPYWNCSTSSHLPSSCNIIKITLPCGCCEVRVSYVIFKRVFISESSNVTRDIDCGHDVILWKNSLFTMSKTHSSSSRILFLEIWFALSWPRDSLPWVLISHIL